MGKLTPCLRLWVATLALIYVNVRTHLDALLCARRDLAGKDLPNEWSEHQHPEPNLQNKQKEQNKRRRQRKQQRESKQKNKKHVRKMKVQQYSAEEKQSGRAAAIQY